MICKWDIFKNNIWHKKITSDTSVYSKPATHIENEVAQQTVMTSTNSVASKDAKQDQKW